MIAQTRDDFTEAVSRINTGNASLNVPPLDVEAIREMASTQVLLAHLCVCLHDTDTSGVMLLMKDQGRWWGWYMYGITASVWRAMAKECAQELVNRGDGAVQVVWPADSAAGQQVAAKFPRLQPTQGYYHVTPNQGLAAL